MCDSHCDLTPETRHIDHPELCTDVSNISFSSELAQVPLLYVTGCYFNVGHINVKLGGTWFFLSL